MYCVQQVLWTHALDIANTFPADQRDQYRSAAWSLRVPFWDWTLNPALPDVVAQPQVTVNTPNGWQTIDNPLYSYTFQSDAAGNGFPTSDPVYYQLCYGDTKPMLTSCSDGYFQHNCPLVEPKDRIEQRNCCKCSSFGQCSDVSLSA